MTGLPDRQLFATPFAGGSGASIAPITDAGADFCFEKGFDSAFSSPHSNGGKYVTRAQMNRIGNLATKNEFYRMCGGINTFDPVFAQKIGGYPKGAILDYFNGTDFLKMLSLVDNNLTDFRNESYGGKWMLLNQGEQELSQIKIASFTNFDIPASGISFLPIYVFRSQYDGILNIILHSVEFGSQIGGSAYVSHIYGSSFLANTFENNESVVYPSFTQNSSGNYNNYNIIPGLPTSFTVRMIYGTGSGITIYPNTNATIVKRGDIVVLCAQNGPERDSVNNMIATFDIVIQP